ncbi:LytR/AlgR family response regulator transcription factor [Mucilaginibacter sp. SJ]|uniref:LytR/AlgR family response regulator transcription factor n=1 Tax=Mucilaginibacter sp. SJ TaxID=3029053 RepID=UPI0023A98C34|nr:LytTR family DNA-binding domain-containing protein [Mucilaginibacter sp. SJ]WEA03858.1 LytTR family DNA-binding domain-containing protein [Mucilaginibacter sp. SJ]
MDLHCIIIDDEPHAVSELADLVRDVPGLHIAETFADARQAIAYLRQNGGVDIVFSDINLPGISGIDSAKLLRKYCRFLVFVSAHREFALEAFGVSANAYLVKPVSRALFMEKIYELTTVEKPAAAPEAEQVLFIKGNSKNSFIKVAPGKIIFIEGMLNYVVIHTEGEKYVTYMGLKDILEKLAHLTQFMRINKSVIISLNHISHLDGHVVFLDNKMSFTIGKTFRDAFRDYIAKRTLNDG